MSDKNTFLKQMSAIIGKALTDLEELDCVKRLHPFDFDKIRRRLIDSCWDAFATGRLSGIDEKEKEDVRQI
jgi:hypothetical protein